MIFREDGKSGAFGSGISYEFGGSGEVVGGVEGLGEEISVDRSEDWRELTEMEDLWVELDDGDFVRRRHG